jgi:hypothetical protein
MYLFNLIASALPATASWARPRCDTPSNSSKENLSISADATRKGKEKPQPTGKYLEYY